MTLKPKSAAVEVVSGTLGGGFEVVNERVIPPTKAKGGAAPLGAPDARNDSNSDELVAV
jgi:hypothetical protein